MAERFVSCNLEEILVGEPLPVNLYLYINFRFITYKAAGDVIDRASYDRFEFKKVRTLFIRDQDGKKFQEWVSKRAAEPAPPQGPQSKALAAAREDAHRSAMDIFLSTHPDKMVEQTMTASKKLATEVMKTPYAVQSLAQLQTYSKGTVDHSVNVSVLSVYLAMQMGYTHNVILQHVGMGGLLHDVGKPRVPITDEDNAEAAAIKMRAHPELGVEILSNSKQPVPEEVKMIIAQHHECHDGTGYPKKLRGAAIYDLARIVSIANIFDELVADGKGTLVERQRHAIKTLDEVLYRKFDPQKLDKALKILKLGV